MSIHLVNPSHVSFGIGVITPRWLYVLAAATPESYGAAGHGGRNARSRWTWRPSRPATSSASAFTQATRCADTRWALRRGSAGATVIYGGIHATLYPDEARDLGGAHAVVTGDGDHVWGEVIRDAVDGTLRPKYAGGQIEGEDFLPARWDLLPEGRYMWASVQTVRGCPKHCSFCSVWRTDGQRPRQRGYEQVVAGDRRAAAPRLPVHRARRRQLLSGHARRPADGGAARRQVSPPSNCRRSAPSASR